MEPLRGITADDLGGLSWRHAPSRWEPLPGEGLRILAPAKTDYFCNPNGVDVSDSAPFLWTSVEGDLAAQVHVRPTFGATYDAGALMVWSDQTHWAKLCFEYTDFGTHAVVSVVTNGLSDDANGVNLEGPDVWLQIVRQGDLFAMHYALDGSDWRMVRYFTLPCGPRVSVGIVAQSPTGPGTAVDFDHFRVRPGGVENMRAGV